MNVAEVHLGNPVTVTGAEPEHNVKLNQKELLSLLTEGNYKIYTKAEMIK